jgi:hypothetical protein
MEGENDSFVIYKGSLFSKDYQELKCIFPAAFKEIVIHEKTNTVDWASIAGQISWMDVSVAIEPGNQFFQSIDGSVFSHDLSTFLFANRSLTSLTKDTLPTETTTIARSCFQYHSKLVSIDLTGTNVVTLDDSAFFNTNTLKTVVLPALTSFGSNAFCACHGLESVSLGEGNTTIGSYAFQWCENLKTVSLPSTLTSIDYGAFSYCTSLRLLELPASLATINDWAFQGCVNLILVLHCKTTGFSSQWAEGANNILFFYAGAQSEWQDAPSNIYFFSENPPTDDGLYWHYVNGKPEAWPVQNSGN